MHGNHIGHTIGTPTINQNFPPRFVLPRFGGDIITTPRSQAYYVVTEYGAANLAGRSTWERADAMISIAHPDFRDELIRAAEQQKIWLPSNKR